MHLFFSFSALFFLEPAASQVHFWKLFQQKIGHGRADLGQKKNIGGGGGGENCRLQLHGDTKRRGQRQRSVTQKKLSKRTMDFFKKKLILTPCVGIRRDEGQRRRMGRGDHPVDWFDDWEKERRTHYGKQMCVDLRRIGDEALSIFLRYCSICVGMVSVCEQKRTIIGHKSTVLKKFRWDGMSTEKKSGGKKTEGGKWDRGES